MLPTSGGEAFDGTAWYDGQPNGLVYAGKVAYKYKGTMPANTSILLDEGTLCIADGVFANCNGLTSITIPSSVTTIGNYAFQNCSGLLSITIPNSVSNIGCFAFEGTAWYDGQPNGLVYAGKVAYKYKGTMPSKTTVILEDGTLGIAGHAFFECSGLLNIVFSNSLQIIGEDAFRDCRNLTNISIPNSVTTIKDAAFWGCNKLTDIFIPNSVYSIGNSVFDGINGHGHITSLLVEEGNDYYDSRDDCFAIIETATNTLIIGGNNSTIPNSVTSIGESAFYGCSGMTSITIPNTVTSIEGWAFAGCSGLTSLTIPESVTSIGYGAFLRCGLINIVIPATVTNIGMDVFKYTPWFNNQPDGLVYAGKVAYRYKGNIQGNTSVVIKDGTLGISGGAFEDCSGLTSIIIPNSVTHIGEQAFLNCEGLTSITIPNSVVSLDFATFEGCI